MRGRKVIDNRPDERRKAIDARIDEKRKEKRRGVKEINKI